MAGLNLLAAIVIPLEYRPSQRSGQTAETHAG